MEYCYGTAGDDHDTELADLSLCEWEPENLENFQPSSGFFLDADMAQEKMELDLELLSSSATKDDMLRRSNSAPLISGLGDNSQVFQADMVTPRNDPTLMTQHCLVSTMPLKSSKSVIDMTAFSSSKDYSGCKGFLPASPIPIRASFGRLHQIKQEEGMNLMTREAMHEWEVQTALRISRSWEESLNLSDSNLEKPSSESIDLIPVSPAAPPTQEIGKQCFPPSLQTCVNYTTLPSSPVPSPTPGFPIGSQNPTNIIRPSICGSLKRKGEMLFEDQPKKLFQGTTSMISSDTTQQSDMNE
ncbi:protein FAM122A-like isoform X2 [Mustela erminea]|uniref:protein FAM122A-like isoform X1 n=2 Tax=Mustela erminea TaxID=36723 RepID=UPI0013869A85|nr:protein FAM122A-like isoform X1 [Mustela erminea]XP_032186967.1 protein FAM122A-like isoform X2 [Mustela erminea]